MPRFGGYDLAMELPPDPTVEFGPRPPGLAASALRPGRRPRAPLTVLLALAGLLALGVGVEEVHRNVSPGSGHATVAGEARCPPLVAGPGAGVALSWSVDLLGVGCAQLVSWHAPVLTIELSDRTVRRYEMGEVGDQLLVGRFGCAAAPLLARYRPATGAVVQYPALRSGLETGGWVEPDAPRFAASHGVARVGRDNSGCESVEVVVHG